MMVVWQVARRRMYARAHPALPAAGKAYAPEPPAGATTITPPKVMLPEPAPLQVVGSRAVVVFGRDTHIALARSRSRARRPQRSGEPVRRRLPVAEREIPSLTEGETTAAPEEQRQRVAMPSLWDLLVAPTSGATQAAPTLVAASSHGRYAPQQPHLWE
jgi:hypothetical protein